MSRTDDDYLEKRWMLTTNNKLFGVSFKCGKISALLTPSLKN